MNKLDKIELIKKLYKEGKIKRFGKNSFIVPSECFIEGITPKMVADTLK